MAISTEILTLISVCRYCIAVLLYIVGLNKCIKASKVSHTSFYVSVSPGKNDNMICKFTAEQLL